MLIFISGSFINFWAVAYVLALKSGTKARVTSFELIEKYPNR